MNELDQITSSEKIKLEMVGVGGHKVLGDKKPFRLKIEGGEHIISQDLKVSKFC